jgi:hypothetical protein
MKPIELANYYCPEKHAKLCDRRIPLRLGLSFGSPEVREVIGTRWKRCVDSNIPPALTIGECVKFTGRRLDWRLGSLAHLVDPQRNDRARAFEVSYGLLDCKRGI